MLSSRLSFSRDASVAEAANKRRLSTRLAPLRASDVTTDGSVVMDRSSEFSPTTQATVERSSSFNMTAASVTNDTTPGIQQPVYRKENAIVDRKLHVLCIFEPVLAIRLRGYCEQGIIDAINEIIVIKVLGDRLMVQSKQIVQLDDGVLLRYPPLEVDPVFRETAFLLHIREAVQDFLPSHHPPDGINPLLELDLADQVAQMPRWRMLAVDKELITQSHMRLLTEVASGDFDKTVHAVDNRMTVVPQKPAKREPKTVETTSMIFGKREEIVTDRDITLEVLREREHTEYEETLVQRKAERVATERRFGQLCRGDVGSGYPRLHALRAFAKGIEENEIPVHFQDLMGRTLLHWIVAWSHDVLNDPKGGLRGLRAMMGFAFDVGISPLLCDNEGNSAVDLANEDGMQAALAELQRLCAQQLDTQKATVHSLRDCVYQTVAGAAEQALFSATQPEKIFLVRGGEVLLQDLKIQRTTPIVRLTAEERAEAKAAEEATRSRRQSRRKSRSVIHNAPEFIQEQLSKSGRDESVTSMSIDENALLPRLRLATVPFSQFTHGTTSVDVLHCSDGRIVAVDYTKAFPEVTTIRTQATYDVFGGEGEGCAIKWLWTHPKCSNFTTALTEEQEREAERVKAELRVSRSSYLTKLAVELRELEAGSVVTAVDTSDRQREESFANKALLYPYGGSGGGDKTDGNQEENSTQQANRKSAERGAEADGRDERDIELAGAICLARKGRLVVIPLALADIHASATASVKQRLQCLGNAIDRFLEGATAVAELPAGLSRPVAITSSKRDFYVAAENGSILHYEVPRFVRKNVSPSANFDEFDLPVPITMSPTRRRRASAPRAGVPLSGADIPTSVAVIREATCPKSGKRLPSVAAWGGKNVYLARVQDDEQADDVFEEEEHLTLFARVEDAAKDEECTSVASCDADPFGVFFVRRGELCRYDTRRRVVSVLFTISLTDSEVESRMMEGDNPTRLPSGVQMLSFNADGTRIMRVSPTYECVCIYSTGHLMERVDENARAIMHINNLICGAGITRAVSLLPRDRLRGYLRRLSSITSIGIEGLQRRVDHAFLVVGALRPNSGSSFEPNDEDLDGRLAGHIVAAVGVNDDMNHDELLEFWEVILQRGTNIYAESKAGIRAVDLLADSYVNTEGAEAYQKRFTYALRDDLPINELRDVGTVQVVDETRAAVFSGHTGWNYVLTKNRGLVATRVKRDEETGSQTTEEYDVQPVKQNGTVAVTLLPLHEHESVRGWCPLLKEADVLLLTDGSVVLVDWKNHRSGTPPTVASASVPVLAASGEWRNIAAAISTSVLTSSLSTTSSPTTVAQIVVTVAAGVAEQPLLPDPTAVTALHLSRAFFKPDEYDEDVAILSGLTSPTNRSPPPESSPQRRSQAQEFVGRLVAAIESAASSSTNSLRIPDGGEVLSVHSHDGIAAVMWQLSGGSVDSMLCIDGSWEPVRLSHRDGRPLPLEADGDGTLRIFCDAPRKVLLLAFGLQQLVVATVDLESDFADNAQASALMVIDASVQPRAETVAIDWVAGILPELFDADEDATAKVARLRDNLADPLVGLMFIREGMLCCWDATTGIVRNLMPLHCTSAELNVMAADGDVTALDSGALPPVLVGGISSLQIINQAHIDKGVSKDDTIAQFYERPSPMIVRVNALHGVVSLTELDSRYTAFSKHIDPTMQTLASTPANEHTVLAPPAPLTSAVPTVQQGLVPPRSRFFQGWIARLSTQFGAVSDQARELRTMLDTIESGCAKPAQRDSDGRTAFHVLAAIRSEIPASDAEELVRRLLRAGCSPFICDARGRSAADDELLHRLLLKHRDSRTERIAATKSELSADAWMSDEEEGQEETVIDVMSTPIECQPISIVWSAVSPTVCYSLARDGTITLHNTERKASTILMQMDVNLEDANSLPSIAVAAVPVPESVAHDRKYTTDVIPAVDVVDDLRATDVLLCSSGAHALVRDPSGKAAVEVHDAEELCRWRSVSHSEATGPASGVIQSGSHAGIEVVWFSTSTATIEANRPLGIVATLTPGERDVITVRRLYAPPGVKRVFARHLIEMIKLAKPMRVQLPRDATAIPEVSSGIKEIQQLQYSAAFSCVTTTATAGVDAQQATPGAFFVTVASGPNTVSYIYDCPSFAPVGIVDFGKSAAVDHNVHTLELRRPSAAIMDTKAKVVRQRFSAAPVFHAPNHVTMADASGFTVFELPKNVTRFADAPSVVVKGDTHHQPPADVVVDASRVAFHPESDHVVAIIDGIVSVYDPDTGAITQVIKGPHGGGDHSVAFSGDGAWLAVWNMHKKTLAFLRWSSITTALKKATAAESATVVGFSYPARNYATSAIPRRKECCPWYLNSLTIGSKSNEEDIKWVFRTFLDAVVSGSVAWNEKDAGGRNVVHLFALYCTQYLFPRDAVVVNNKSSTSDDMGSPTNTSMPNNESFRQGSSILQTNEELVAQKLRIHEVEQILEFLVGMGCSFFSTATDGKSPFELLTSSAPEGFAKGPTFAAIAAVFERFSSFQRDSVPTITQSSSCPATQCDLRQVTSTEGLRSFKHCGLARVGEHRVHVTATGTRVLASAQTPEDSATQLYAYEDDATEKPAFLVVSLHACRDRSRGQDVILCSDGMLLCAMEDISGSTDVSNSKQSPEATLGALRAFRKSSSYLCRLINENATLLDLSIVHDTASETVYMAMLLALAEIDAATGKPLLDKPKRTVVRTASWELPLEYVAGELDTPSALVRTLAAAIDEQGGGISAAEVPAPAGACGIAISGKNALVVTTQEKGLFVSSIASPTFSQVAVSTSATITCVAASPSITDTSDGVIVAVDDKGVAYVIRGNAVASITAITGATKSSVSAGVSQDGSVLTLVTTEPSTETSEGVALRVVAVQTATLGHRVAGVRSIKIPDDGAGVVVEGVHPIAPDRLAVTLRGGGQGTKASSVRVAGGTGETPDETALYGALYRAGTQRSSVVQCDNNYVVSISPSE